MKKNGKAVANYHNELLARLSSKELDRLAPYFQLEDLVKDQILYEPGAYIKQVYFPEDSFLCLLGGTEPDHFIEVGAAGNKGMVGIQTVLQKRRMPYRVLVQMPGRAWSLSAIALKKEFERGQQLHDLLLRYLHVLLTQLSQSVVCNRFHRIEERFSRWLLACRAEVKKDELPMTHQAMARLLGVPRTLITMTARNLQEDGAIEYKHGRISILNRHRLVDRACECHRIVQKEAGALLRYS